MKYIRYLKQKGMKKFLYICNRTALKEQVQHNYNNVSGLDAINYQALENLINFDNSEYYSKYDCYILDECHYLLDDSTFNRYTDLVFWWIMQQHKTRIFLSATGKDIFNYIKTTVSDLKKNSSYSDEVYELPEIIQNQLQQNYDYVNGLYWLYKKSDIIILLNAIKNDKKGKVVYFADNLQKISSIIKDKSLEISKDDCCFYYGNNSNTTDFAKNYKKINNIIEFINSDKRFLFTTIALDNGIDIKDFNVKHIICNIFDSDSVVQCLGRKRVENKNDKCNFYVVIPSKEELESKLKNTETDMAEIDLFKESPNKWEIWDNKRIDGRITKSRFIYYDPNNLDSQGRPIRTLNTLAEEKVRLIKKDLGYMLGINDEHIQMSYKTLLLQKLHIDDNKCHNINELSVFKSLDLERQQSLMKFLNKYKNKELDDNALIELTKLCRIVTRSKKRIAPIKKINSFFDSNKIQFLIKTRKIKATKASRKSIKILVFTG